MLMFIMMIGFPLIVGIYAGSRRCLVGFIALLLLHFFVFAGFAAGLLLCALFENSSYFQNYQLPELWTNTWLNGLDSDDALWKYTLVTPYMFLADMWRVYFHFNFTNFSIPLLIPELMSFKLMWDMVRRS